MICTSKDESQGSTGDRIMDLLCTGCQEAVDGIDWSVDAILRGDCSKNVYSSN